MVDIIEASLDIPFQDPFCREFSTKATVCILSRILRTSTHPETKRAWIS
jgi:hypothetical protein